MGEKAPPTDESIHEPTPVAEASEPVKVAFFKSTLWNTLVVGWASFLAPGIYNALASTGAGGLADVRGLPSSSVIVQKLTDRSISVTRPPPLRTV